MRIPQQENMDNKEAYGLKRRAGRLICKETIIGFGVMVCVALLLLFGSIFLDETTPLYIIHEDRLELMMYESMPRHRNAGGRTTIQFLLFGGYQVPFEDIERIGLSPYSAVELSRRVEGLDVRPIEGRVFGPRSNLHGYHGDFYLHVSRREGDTPTLVIGRYSNPTILLSRRRAHEIRNLYRNLSVAHRRWRQANGLEVDEPQEATAPRRTRNIQTPQQRAQDAQLREQRVREINERARERLNRRPGQRSQ